MSQAFLAVARRFAAALDAEDYVAARDLLAENCVYQIPQETIAGRDAIVESYRINGDAAKRRFDSVEYVSEAKATGASTATILFTDRLRLGDERHEFQCRQHVRIGSCGLIEEITHEELPGQRQLLAEFEGVRARKRG